MNGKYKRSEEGLIKQKPLNEYLKKVENLKDRKEKTMLALEDS